MSGEQLREIRSGALLGPLYRNVVQHLCDIREGVVPEEIAKQEGDVRSLVAVDPTSRGNEELVITWAHIHEGSADIVGLEARNYVGFHDPNVVKGLVSVAMGESGVKLGLLSRNSTNLDTEALINAGFQQRESGDFEFIQAA